MAMEPNLLTLFSLTVLFVGTVAATSKQTLPPIDEMLPDELDDDDIAAVNDDGLGNGPDGLVQDIVVGRRSPDKDKPSPKNRRPLSNCSQELLASLTRKESSETKKPPVVVTWSTVINSYSFDPVKSQLTVVADVILSWAFDNPSLGESCRNVDTLLVEPASLIWTPRFVFLNNLDASNILPSDMWEKWPAVVHLDRRLVMWHFAARFTVPCSFKPDNQRPTSLAALCPVKIAGISSPSLFADTLLNPGSVADNRAFIFKAGEISVLHAHSKGSNHNKFIVEANAAPDVPALVFMARVDVPGYLGAGGTGSLLHGFRILRVRVMSLQEDDDGDTGSFYYFRAANLYCLITFFGSFLVFLISSVSITLVIIGWYERTMLPQVNNNNPPPSYASSDKTKNDDDPMLISAISTSHGNNNDNDDKPILITKPS